MGDWRRTKYEEIYDNYLKNGLKFKKYFEINNLNYHNTQIGIYHFRKKKELIYFYLNVMNYFLIYKNNMINV